MKTSTREFVRYWVPVFLWMLIIFGASTDLGSAEHTSRFLIPFLQWIRPRVTPLEIVQFEFFVRKAAHLTEYAILAILLVRAFVNRREAGFVRHAAIVLVIAAIYAATDEFHQTFVGSRTPSPRDVMIDCCGAAVGLLAYRMLTLRTPAAAKTRS